MHNKHVIYLISIYLKSIDCILIAFKKFMIIYKAVECVGRISVPFISLDIFFLHTLQINDKHRMKT